VYEQPIREQVGRVLRIRREFNNAHTVGSFAMGEQLPPPGLPGEGDGSGERGVILRSLYAGQISLQVAGEMLAAETLKGDDMYRDLKDTWSVIQGEAYRSTSHHQTLVELLATIADLPPARDDQGNQLKIYDLRVWGESRRYFGLDDVQLTHWPQRTSLCSAGNCMTTGGNVWFHQFRTASRANHVLRL
jgi:hypothetical protein